MPIAATRDEKRARRSRLLSQTPDDLSGLFDQAQCARIDKPRSSAARPPRSSKPLARLLTRIVGTFGACAAIALPLGPGFGLF